MRARVAAVTAAAAVLLVTATTAVAVTVTVEDRGGADGVRGGIMSAPWQNPREDRRGWQHPGWMLPGMPAVRHPVGVRTEYGYLSEMVAHHREAVAAAHALERSDRAEMRAFGAEVVATQSKQIEQMRRWLAGWYPDRSGWVHHQPMMRNLTGLGGDRLDRVFLQDMTVHHMAAVMMSQQLLIHGRAPHLEVAALARTIRDRQHADMLQMQRWVQHWFGENWRHWPGRDDWRSGGRGMDDGGWAGFGFMH